MVKSKNNNEHIVFHNGHYLPESDVCISIDNRSFRYGDGLFETMVFFDGLLPFLPHHLKRLFAGMNVLKMQVPIYLNHSFLQHCTQKLAQLNGQQQNAVVRLQVYRQGKGKYTPITNEIGILLRFAPLPNNRFFLPPKGLSIGIFKDICKPTHKLANFKTSNSLIFVLAGLFAKEKQLDDALIINEKGGIAEATSSSIFLVKNHELHTPNLKAGSVWSIMQQTIIQLAHLSNVKVRQQKIVEEDLKQADEIWLTNAVQGIKWVANLATRKYTNQLASQFIQLLNTKIDFIVNTKLNEYKS